MSRVVVTFIPGGSNRWHPAAPDYEM